MTPMSKILDATCPEWRMAVISGGRKSGKSTAIAQWAADELQKPGTHTILSVGTSNGGRVVRAIYALLPAEVQSEYHITTSYVQHVTGRRLNVITPSAYERRMLFTPDYTTSMLIDDAEMLSQSAVEALQRAYHLWGDTKWALACATIPANVHVFVGKAHLDAPGSVVFLEKGH